MVVMVVVVVVVVATAGNQGVGRGAQTAKGAIEGVVGARKGRRTTACKQNAGQRGADQAVDHTLVVGAIGR